MINQLEQSMENLDIDNPFSLLCHGPKLHDKYEQTSTNDGSRKSLNFINSHSLINVSRVSSSDVGITQRTCNENKISSYEIYSYYIEYLKFLLTKFYQIKRGVSMPKGEKEKYQELEREMLTIVFEELEKNVNTLNMIEYNIQQLTERMENGR